MRINLFIQIGKYLIRPERDFYLDKVCFFLELVMKIYQHLVPPTKTWIISKILISEYFAEIKTC